MPIESRSLMFSIVVPLYNKERNIQRTIESILFQNMQNFEIIVVNDGSTDRSREVVSQIQDKRIRIIDKTNGGVSSARNLGIVHSAYDYIAFLDGDDVWRPNFLNTIAALICDFPEARAYATGFSHRFNDSGDMKHNLRPGHIKRGILKHYFALSFKYHLIMASAICLHKQIFKLVKPFDETLNYGEDIDLWARVANVVPIAYDPVPEAFYVLNSVNRAMPKLPPVNKILPYYIADREIKDKDELRYFQKFIYNRVKDYLLAKDLRSAWRLIKRNWAVMKPSHYLRFLMRHIYLIINK